ncbi:MAG: divergent polysaccharide deacetylase family protein [Gammaproteobacteria bacterium]|nr:divergent polysaccharide deacetylase family protein [Gammaproteobacteria bacterium]
MRALAWLSLLLIPVCTAGPAAPLPTGAVPKLAIIIDDIGPRYRESLAATDLPGKLTLALLPQQPNAARLAERAARNGKEIMLHLPLEASNGKALGPGGITLHMGENEFRQRVRDNLASIPHVRGVNNHMGSLLTRHPGAMTWLMDELRQAGNVYFIDSRTDHRTVALRMAAEAGLPRAERDLFLDNVQDSTAIRAELERAVMLAKAQGQAVAIAHPYPETLLVFQQELADFRSRHGVELVLVSELLAASTAAMTTTAEFEEVPDGERTRSPR